MNNIFNLKRRVMAHIYLGYTKNLIAKTALTTGIKAITGLELEMRGIDVGILKSVVSVEDLKIFNPKEFSDKIMADLPRIYVSYDLGAFLKNKVHLRELSIELTKLTVERNNSGKLNIEPIKTLIGNKGKSPEIKIDDLGLRIGKVVFKDYSQGSKPFIKEFNVNINEHYRNITDPKALPGIILVRALGKTDIASLTNFDLGGLKNEVSNNVQGMTSNLATESAEKAKAALESLKKTGQDTINKLLQPGN